MISKARKPEPKTYEAHRERQRRRILSAAEKVFDERGIDRTTMAEVIAASELRPSTIYQYFANKDEIVWAILAGVLEEQSGQVQGVLHGLETGLARISALLEYMADELRDHPARIRFMAQFDAMYARDWPVERLISLETHLQNHGFEVFRGLILEGMADGSLRADLDPGLTLHAVVNAVIGAQRRLASLGAKVEEEYGQSIEKLFRETIRILIFGLRAEPQAGN